jgi:hypothetical protein
MPEHNREYPDKAYHPARRVGRRDLVGQMASGENKYYNHDTGLYEDESGLASAESEAHLEGTQNISKMLGKAFNL